MIRNVFGKALTESTLLNLKEYNSVVKIEREKLAKLAQASKNLQGKGKDEEEAVRYVESLRDQWMEEKLTMGWIYNATGAAITLVDSRLWAGRLAFSNPYPVQIENGQWGLLVFGHTHSVSSGAVVYEGLDSSSQTCYWCVAWKVTHSIAQVLVKIENGFSNSDNKWKNVHKELEESGSVHRAEHEQLLSVISTSPGPRAVFEALLTLKLPSNGRPNCLWSD